MFDLQKYNDSVAAFDESGIFRTYAQLDAECNSLSDQVGAGRCLAFCLCQNTVGSLMGYVAFLNSRIVPLLLDENLDRELLRSLIDNYRPDYLWLPANSAREFAYQKIYEAMGYALVKTPFSKAYALHPDLALLLTTSGSTGSPKLVRQSYANIRANTESIIEYLELDKTERPVTTLPMAYTYGLSIISTHLYIGASIVLTRKPLMNREFWQQARAHEVTSFGGVPYTYEMLDRLRFFTMDLPALRTMTQAGGKLSPELHRKFAQYAMDTGKRFVIMYGQTEATARMAYLPHQRALDKAGSMGIAIPGGKLSLIDVHGNEITQPEATGELVYEGENVTLGYAESGHDLCKEDERHGRLLTGDMARRDAEGYYYIVGRKKRFLKIFGSRTNLDEMERMVKAQFPDMDCACGGVDDKMWVFITDQQKKAKVLAFLTQKTGFNHVAFEVRAIEAIPKNEAGKTQYVMLEQHY